jgi:hypothetical protein
MREGTRLLLGETIAALAGFVVVGGRLVAVVVAYVRGGAVLDVAELRKRQERESEPLVLNLSP